MLMVVAQAPDARWQQLNPSRHRLQDIVQTSPS